MTTRTSKNKPVYKINISFIFNLTILGFFSSLQLHQCCCWPGHSILSIWFILASLATTYLGNNWSKNILGLNLFIIIIIIMVLEASCKSRFCLQLAGRAMKISYQLGMTVELVERKKASSGQGLLPPMSMTSPAFMWTFCYMECMVQNLKLTIPLGSTPNLMSGLETKSMFLNA